MLLLGLDTFMIILLSVFNNGITIQWSIGTTKNTIWQKIVYPISFSAKTFHITSCLIGGNVDFRSTVRNATTEGFELGGGRSTNVDIYWLAVGI